MLDNTVVQCQTCGLLTTWLESSLRKINSGYCGVTHGDTLGELLPVDFGEGASPENIRALFLSRFDQITIDAVDRALAAQLSGNPTPDQYRLLYLYDRWVDDVRRK